ncbi:MAG: peptidylprolyl isomerase [Alphaproteobacteria bacterium]|nr:peptidylprolyl isomerase [Alphaproteobacteria bacterium]
MGLWWMLACTGTSPTVVDAPVAPVSQPWPEATEARYAASHILIAWKGAVGAGPSVVRSEPEAGALARELSERAKTEDFAALARAHSDGPSGARGGGLGVYVPGTLPPEVERSVASVEVGRLAPIVRTPFGWHVLRRDAIEVVEVAHVVVGFAGASRSTATRTEDEARALAESVRAEILAGADFATVARARSEDGSAVAGGSLGEVARGVMEPAFEDAAFALQPGGTSEVVRTSHGFHVVRRVR